MWPHPSFEQYLNIIYSTYRHHHYLQYTVLIKDILWKWMVMKVDMTSRFYHSARKVTPSFISDCFHPKWPFLNSLKRKNIFHAIYFYNDWKVISVTKYNHLRWQCNLRRKACVYGKPAVLRHLVCCAILKAIRPADWRDLSNYLRATAN